MTLIICLGFCTLKFFKGIGFHDIFHNHHHIVFNLVISNTFLSLENAVQNKKQVFFHFFLMLELKLGFELCYTIKM